MNIDELVPESRSFSEKLGIKKACLPDVQWYPYNSFANFIHMQMNFAGAGRDVFADVRNSRIIDIGAADGDTSFFLESLGAKVTILDNASTNFNSCAGIKSLTQELDSDVQLIEQDLDFTPDIKGEYDLALFLGIMYHLRNPMLVLNAIAQVSSRMLVSTLICSRLSKSSPIIKDYDPNIDDEDLGYLLPARAYNNDPTNYWVMTPAGMRTMLKRSGWVILDEFRIGDVGISRPDEGDQRMFCYCERHPAWRDLRKHHDF